MASLIHHLDKKQFIISTEPDLNSRAGNSAQHTMMFNMLGFFLNKSDEVYLQGAKRTLQTWLLMIARDGEPRLYWDDRYWPGQKGHMSRDNLFCSILALKLYKLRSSLFSLMLLIFLRLGRLWNNTTIGATKPDKPWYAVDWCGPLMWFIVFRSKWNPLNYLSDIYFIVCIYFADKSKDSGNHLNLIMYAQVADFIAPNFILDHILNNYKELALMAAQDYFDTEFSPPLHKMLAPLINLW